MPKIRAVLFCVVTACSGGSTDIDATLRFSDRTDLEISRLVAAASGSEGFQVQAQLSSFEHPFDTDPCPAITEDAAARRITITGGCTTRDGERIDGSAEITNPLGWGELDYDFTSDSVFAPSQLVIERSGFRTMYDGTFRIGSSYEELDMDLDTEQLGVVVRSDIFMDCDPAGCDIDNSGVELIGAGGVLVSGSIGVAGSQTRGSLTLRGADTVAVAIANGCVSWRLVGTDRAFSPCQQ